LPPQYSAPGEINENPTRLDGFLDWFPGPDGKIRLVQASDGVNKLLFHGQESAFKPIIMK